MIDGGGGVGAAAQKAEPQKKPQQQQRKRPHSSADAGAGGASASEPASGTPTQRKKVYTMTPCGAKPFMLNKDGKHSKPFLKHVDQCNDEYCTSWRKKHT